jgi:uncharacterized protein (DUF2235 family)
VHFLTRLAQGVVYVGKNIVVCLDGTGNQLRAKGNTNVVLLYEMLDLSEPSKQIAYYDPGVGTFSSPGAWTPLARRVSKLAGLAVGVGLRANLGEVYTYLMQHYEAGDKLFVFGFSRGAYCARALAGLLNTAGLLRPGSENLVSYAISVYARNKDLSDDDWRQIHMFAGAFSRKVGNRTAVPIEFMGVWDSVKAAGILRWNLRCPSPASFPMSGPCVTLCPSTRSGVRMRSTWSNRESSHQYRWWRKSGLPVCIPMSAAPSRMIRACRGLRSNGWSMERSTPG